MTHDYHQGQENYSPNQVLFDGCNECLVRAAEPWEAITHLDPDRFISAWNRARKWQIEGLDDGSYTEIPILRILWAVQQKMEQSGLKAALARFYEEIPEANQWWPHVHPGEAPCNEMCPGYPKSVKAR